MKSGTSKTRYRLWAGALTLAAKYSQIQGGKAMRPMAMIVLAVFTFSFAGCTLISTRPVVRSYEQFEQESKNSARWAEVFNLYKQYNLDENHIARYDNLPKEAKKEYRNNYITSRILAYDLWFESFQHNLAREGVVFEMGTEMSQLALTGAGAVVPGAATKTVLSAIAAGVTGAKGAVEKDYFLKQTMQVMLVKMSTNRATVLKNIKENMKKETADYPLSAALIDLEDYYRAGTLTQALISINEKPTTEAQKQPASPATGPTTGPTPKPTPKPAPKVK